MSDRTDHEARRLRQVADAAGLDGVALWGLAVELAAAAERIRQPIDQRSSLVRMRRLLEAQGVEHRLPDPFGTRPA